MTFMSGPVKLDASRGAVDVIVIDRVDRPNS
jgi:hypothetical protein